MLATVMPVLRGANDYKPGPDSQPQAGVAKGELIKDVFDNSQVYPGTSREVTIYIPAGLDRSKPAPIMVFQDGIIYQAPAVFDNLIARKEIPPLIGIFITPGVLAAVGDNALPRFNRSFEYDSVTDDYSRFLLTELLPALQVKHGLHFSEDPGARAIAGSSSGGICAFMVAWHRPDQFQRVFTNVGTYVGIHGADKLPVLVRKVEPKPLRLFLQSGVNDNNLYCGDWWMANQMMERSFTWAGYDVKHEWGDGGHNQKHATAIFPDVLRWLWKGYPNELVTANPRKDSKWRGYEVFPQDSQWEEVSLPGEFWGGAQLAANVAGELFLSGRKVEVPGDAPPHYEEGLWKVDVTGTAAPFAASCKDIKGLAVDPQGRLRVAAWEHDALRILALDEKGAETGKAIEVPPVKGNDRPNPQDLCFSHAGWCYFNDADQSMLFAVSPKGEVETLQIPADQFSKPESVVLSPDQTLIYTPGESYEGAVASFQADERHLFANGQRYFRLERDTRRPMDNVGATGSTVDAEGRLYVATAPGIQVCDQAGRVNFIVPTPMDHVSDVAFAGKDLSTFYILSEGRLFKRQTRVHGVVSGQQAPIKPAAPKL